MALTSSARISCTPKPLGLELLSSARPTRDLVDDHSPGLELARDQHLAFGNPQRLEKEPFDEPGVLGRVHDEQPQVRARNRTMGFGGRGRQAQARLSLTIPASRRIAGITAGRDEVLEKALAYVRSAK